MKKPLIEQTYSAWYFSTQLIQFYSQRCRDTSVQRGKLNYVDHRNMEL